MGKGEGGINLEFESNIYILLYIKQINRKNLQYSTGDYTQYLVIERNLKKEYIFIYIHVSHFTKHLKLTDFKSTIRQLNFFPIKKLKNNNFLKAISVYGLQIGNGHSVCS